MLHLQGKEKGMEWKGVSSAKVPCLRRRCRKDRRAGAGGEGRQRHARPALVPARRSQFYDSA